MRCMIDQRVQTEFGDAAFQQIVEAWLGEVKPLSGGGLCNISAQSGFVDGKYQFGARLHVGGVGF